MTYAIVSLNDQRYQPLADLTWTKNKEIYAQKHGYKAMVKTDNFYNINVGFEKIWFVNDILNQNLDIEWVWCTDCDSMVTNMTIKIEDRIDDNYHFIIASDWAGLNAGSWFVKNSEQGRNFIKLIMSQYDKYCNHGWAEQQCIIDNYNDNKDIIKIVPQRQINAYQCSIHPNLPKVDQYGNDSDWKMGDFFIHWPASPLDMRINLANEYMKKVII
jgi:hypothetical protein